MKSETTIKAELQALANAIKGSAPIHISANAGRVLRRTGLRQALVRQVHLRMVGAPLLRSSEGMIVKMSDYRMGSDTLIILGKYVRHAKARDLIVDYTVLTRAEFAGQLAKGMTRAGFDRQLVGNVVRELRKQGGR